MHFDLIKKVKWVVPSPNTCIITYEPGGAGRVGDLTPVNVFLDG